MSASLRVAPHVRASAEGSDGDNGPDSLERLLSHYPHARGWVGATTFCTGLPLPVTLRTAHTVRLLCWRKVRASCRTRHDTREVMKHPRTVVSSLVSRVLELLDESIGMPMAARGPRARRLASGRARWPLPCGCALYCNSYIVYVYTTVLTAEL